MKRQLFKPELCLMLLSAWYCTSAQNPSRETKHISVISSGSYDADHVYREINLETRRKVLERSKGKKILINIYPVKQGNVFSNKDMILKIFFQDVKGPMTDLSDKVNKKNFTKQSANYLSFLKQNNISGKNVPHSYYAIIDADRLVQADEIAFYLSIKNSHLAYYLLSEKKARENERDSTGKCPPCNLSQRTLLLADSTGKCPPCALMHLFNK
jgi:hypothetical protein